MVRTALRGYRLCRLAPLACAQRDECFPLAKSVPMDQIGLLLFHAKRMECLVVQKSSVKLPSKEQLDKYYCGVRVSITIAAVVSNSDCPRH